MAPTEDLLTDDMSPEDGTKAINLAMSDVVAKLALLNDGVEDATTKAANAQRVAAEYKAQLDALTESRKLALTVSQHDSSDAGLRRYYDGEGIVLVDRSSKADGHRPGLLTSRTTHGDWHADLQRAVTDYGFAQLWAQNSRTTAIGGMAHRSLLRVLESGPAEITKRIFGETGAGAEWAPTQIMMPELDRAVGLAAEGRVLARFPVTQMTGAVYTSPILSGSPTVYRKGVPVSNPANALATDVSTTTRTKTSMNFIARLEVDRDSEEDAIFDTRSEFIRLLADSLTDAKEDAFINGDTATSAIDDFANWNPRSRWDTTYLGNTTVDHRRGQIGLRAMAFDDGNTLDMGSLQSFAGITQLRSMLSARSGTALMICSEKWLWLKLMVLAEVVTQDKRGSQATIDTGVLNALAGMSLIPSYFVTDDLNASGLYDNSTKTKSSLICVDPSQVRQYQRRAAGIEVASDIATQSMHIVATERWTFDRAIGSDKPVALGYNLL